MTLKIDPNIPKNGWLVYSPAIGEHCIASPNLDCLAAVVGGIIDRTMKKYPDLDGSVIHVYELGRKMAVGLDYKVVKLETLEKESPVVTGSCIGRAAPGENVHTIIPKEQKPEPLCKELDDWQEKGCGECIACRHNEPCLDPP